jgi:hypothetical protein
MAIKKIHMGHFRKTYGSSENYVWEMSCLAMGVSHIYDVPDLVRRPFNFEVQTTSNQLALAR